MTEVDAMLSIGEKSISTMTVMLDRIETLERAIGRQLIINEAVRQWATADFKDWPKIRGEVLRALAINIMEKTK